MDTQSLVMDALQRLHQLLNSNDIPEDTVVAYHQGQGITLAVFKQQLQNVSHFIAQKPQQHFLLHSDNAYAFLLAFIALLVNQKTILLSANIQPQWLQDIEQQFEVFIGDVRLNGIDNLQLNIQELLTTSANSASSQPQDFVINEHSSIVFFTSGSTEKPKTVHKTFNQLLAEIQILEQTFKLHKKSHIIASVSQQHIYGLLFRVLWPFIYSRTFESGFVEYPEQLAHSFKHNITNQNSCVFITSPAFLSRLDPELIYQQPEAIFSSGGPLNFDAATKSNELLGSLPIEVFGSTETGGIAYRQQKQNSQPWQLFQGLTIQHKDSISHLNSPYLSQRDFPLDDHIEMIDDKFFHLKGRLDRVIKIEEKRVSLQQLEKHLLAHPWVGAAKIIVLKQNRHILGAVIELNQTTSQENTKTITQQLKQFCLQKFEPVTVPRKWRLVEKMPYNSQGKLSYLDLEHLFMQEKS